MCFALAGGLCSHPQDAATTQPSITSAAISTSSAEAPSRLPRPLSVISRFPIYAPCSDPQVPCLLDSGPYVVFVWDPAHAYQGLHPHSPRCHHRAFCLLISRFSTYWIQPHALRLLGSDTCVPRTAVTWPHVTTTEVPRSTQPVWYLLASASYAEFAWTGGFTDLRIYGFTDLPDLRIHGFTDLRVALLSPTSPLPASLNPICCVHLTRWHWSMRTGFGHPAARITGAELPNGYHMRGWDCIR